MNEVAYVCMYVFNIYLVSVCNFGMQFESRNLTTVRAEEQDLRLPLFDCND